MRKKKSADEKAKFVRIERSTLEEVSNFLFAIGNQFTEVKNAQGAFDSFKYAVDLNPKNQPSVYNLGVLYNLMGNQEGAYRMLSEARRMLPSHLVASVSLAEVCRKLGKVNEARELLDAVLKVDPENFVCMSSMALLEYDLANLSSASRWNDEALKRFPTDPHMLLNRCLINMLYGRWQKEWLNYELYLSYRKTNDRMSGLDIRGSWHGQECEGKNLVVVSDQGSGDCIQFGRYLREAKALGKFGAVTYIVQPDLVELMSRVEGIDRCIGFGDSCDLKLEAYSSLLGIMRVLQISPDSCKRPPHIVTDPDLDLVWKTRIDQLWDGKSKKVGIVWGGDQKHGNDVNRSLPLAQFLKLTHVQGVQLFSFQLGNGLKQLFVAPEEEQKKIVELGTDFRSFDDTASAMRQMDLLITCDTAPGHLAGSMGIPTWWLIPNPGEWRHGIDTLDSLWYAESRLFRQKTPKDWNPVIDLVVDELRKFAA